MGDLELCLHFLWNFPPFHIHSSCHIIPTVLLGDIVVMAWLCFGTTIVIPSSCLQGLDYSILFWPSTCESLCKCVLLFLDVNYGPFFFGSCQPSCHFCKILAVATFKLIFVGENPLRLPHRMKRA